MKQIVKALEDQDQRAIRIGNDVLFPPLDVNGRAFYFNPTQTRFLYALQVFKGDLERSASFVNQDAAWAEKFIASKKFRAFRSAKVALMAARNGDLIDWWWKMGIDGARGFIRRFTGVCHLCHETNIYDVSEISMTEDDNLKCHPACKICLQPVEIAEEILPVRASREQVQFWSELGNRLAPKIERVQHEFSKETFKFVSGGQDAVG